MGRTRRLLHSQRKIIPIAAFVVRLERVLADGDCRVIGQVGESAADRIGGSVIDRGENCAGGEPFVSYRLEGKLCVRLDSYPIGDYLIGCGLFPVERARVGPIGHKSERPLDC